jgi:hypothetical protein
VKQSYQHERFFASKSPDIPSSCGTIRGESTFHKTIGTSYYLFSIRLIIRVKVVLHTELIAGNIGAFRQKIIQHDFLLLWFHDTGLSQQDLNKKKL